MFSGIVEEAAQVVKLEKEKDNLHITMKCSFMNDLRSIRAFHIMVFVLQL